MSIPNMKTAEDLATEVVESGRISRGEVLILSDRLSLLQWASRASKVELFAARDAYAREWSEADDRDGAAVAQFESEQFDKPAGRPRK